jgi:hypothetical protein
MDRIAAAFALGGWLGGCWNGTCRRDLGSGGTLARRPPAVRCGDARPGVPLVLLREPVRHELAMSSIRISAVQCASCGRAVIFLLPLFVGQEAS